MSLRKSPTRTPAFLEAIRRNAQQSTGPWTARGKAQSCLNRLKTGARSRVFRRLWFGLLNAPPCAVEQTATELLTRQQVAHPVFAEVVDLALWAEAMTASGQRWFRELVEPKQKAWATGENQPQELTPAGGPDEESRKEREHLTPRPKCAQTQRKQSTFSLERGRVPKKKMLGNDVGSRNVVENKGNNDILSCYRSDILGNLKPILTENAHFGATKITFSMGFGRQCRAFAMPRFEPPDLPDTRRRSFRQLAPDVDLLARLTIAQAGKGDSGPAAPASQGTGAEPGRGRSSTSVTAEGATSGSDSMARAG